VYAVRQDARWRVLLGIEHVSITFISFRLVLV